MLRLISHGVFAMLCSLFAFQAMALPTGNYECTQSQVFQFDETGQGFGVASVLSTDIVFSLMPPKEGSTLVYQEAGTTYLIDSLADEFAKFKFRVVYSGDLRTFSGYCHKMAQE